jgi:homoaconitate hydratase
MPQTLVEKIAQRHAVGLPAGAELRAGDFVTIRPAHVMTHDNTGAVIPKFRSIGATRVHDPSQPVFALDHDVQNRSEANLAKYARIEEFAREQGVAFYPAGTGIGHQIMIEQGYALPGSMVVASDSHANMYGAVGALGTPVVRTDAAALWATATTWWQVPETVRVVLTGALRPGVSGKDVILTLCGVFNQDEVLNGAVEFHGEGLASLGMDARMTIANMTTEWGALVGLFPADGVTREYLEERVRRLGPRSRMTTDQIATLFRGLPEADEGAGYAREIRLDLSSVSPYVSGPDTVKVITPIAEMEEKKLAIQKAYLLSCVNSRLEDIAEAAAVMKGGTVAPGVALYLAAASAEVEEEARRLGHWQALLEAGARPLPPGCGPCIGLGEGLLEKGQVGISATNRNFKGRMGDREARCYLASPAVVAASALAGHIRAPEGSRGGAPVHEIRELPRRPAEAEEVPVLEGFPAEVTGRLLYLPADNLNTDGIYGKDYTYRDDLGPEQMAAVAMENYDPEFQRKAAEDDLIVGGRNFGTGSSREQAATALKHRGIRLVIAASFSQTYKRNAFNNGYLCVECPALTDLLAEEFRMARERGDRTIVTGREATVDFARSELRYGERRFALSPIGPVPQELIIAGGSENLVRSRL